MGEAAILVLLFTPVAFILWLANLADQMREQGRSGTALAGIAYALFGLFYGGLLIAGIVVPIAGSLAAAQPGAAGPGGAAAAQVAEALPRLGLSLALPAIAGLVLLLPPVRRLFARFIPIEPKSTTHASALALTMLIVVNLAATLAMGLTNLADAMSEQGASYNPLPGLWTQDIVLAIISLVGVGWLSRRPLREAMRRLGLVAPTWRQVIGAIVLAIVLVPIAIAVEYAASAAGVGPGEEVQRLSELLVGPLTQSIPGVLTLGLAAALGEESIFRGALQPRFGLLFTSILFALLHSQYGLSFATAFVFVLGLVLGLVRQRANTSTSMVLHAVYNMSLGLVSFLGLMPGS